MATIVAEAVLSAFVEVLLEKMISHEFINFIRTKKLNVSLLENLKTTLLSLQSILNDAEEKQITNHAVKQWLENLRDVVFEADDLFDKINTEAIRCKVEAEYQQGKTVCNKVKSIFSSSFYGVINSEMQTLFERLEHFAQKGHVLGLKESVSCSVWHRTPTSSVVDESTIYGRDCDRKKLKDFLLSENASDCGKEIGVISIVGMGGIGKTTLAKLLYNDSEVKEKFDLKGWAYISKDFDIVQVTKTLVESVTSKTIDTNNMNTSHTEFVTTKNTDTNDLNTLQVQLQQSLSHKKFLIVLDDIWDRRYIDWNNLKDIFNAGKIGSKIIITTRDERVALAVQTFLPIHYLTPLGSDECWSLLAKHAFGACNFQQRSNLEVIGKEIAKKCDGLPLAAVALGGLLRTKSSEDDWNDVLKSNVWSLENVESSRLGKKTMVELWIAEGLVHQSKSQKSWEKVGEEYFDELVSRSLIHRQLVDDEEESFEMHDLINDLATMVSSPYCIKLDEEELHEKVRHLSYNRGKYDSYNKFEKLCGLKGLRTFLALPLQLSTGSQSQSDCSLSDKVVHDLLPRMKQLRVLSMPKYRHITKLPDSIGNLIHLRYLNLSYTGIERLPSTICKLYNLQTLLLFKCGNLTELPKDMGKLVNLRHLDIRGAALKEMPVQISKLQNLQTLSNFIVSKQHDGLKIAELGKFPHLKGNLFISKLQNVTEPCDASYANLMTKKQIDWLVLQWNPQTSPTMESKTQSFVLEQLRPSPNVKNLGIHGYGGTNFPKWLGDSSFGNMVSMSIGACHHCSLLPPLGKLQCLKQLRIYWMASIKSVGAEFFGSNCPSFQPFPSLETLKFEDMPEWEIWNLIGGTTIAFPRLKCLLVDRCPKLKGNIPSTLPSLTELHLSECDLLLEARQSADNSNIILRPSDVFSQLMFPFNSLRKLTLDRLPSLTSFPSDGLPKTLQSLSLHYCENLEFLPHESLHNYTSLEKLSIEYSCNSMTSFTLGSLPVLQSLYIKGCEKLESIFIARDASQSLSFIQSIEIRSCDELVSFSPGGLSTPNLICFRVYGCNKLHSLPESMNTLVSLQELRVFSLPNLQHFAEEGLPINLRKLSVGGIMWNMECSLQCITNLSVLEIGGCEILNKLMRMKVSLLPSSLMSLHIYQLDDIECLDGKWLHHLTSLQNLEISDAPKLKSLPEEGLPSSLSVLSISDCPLLEATWQKKKGKEWRKIACIPCILINYKMIS
ncbi:putative disease resistance protein At3g14460 isoform X2 [Trifolium pratense]|uniref:putative disease resistance protein At3g14460 isoform X2 n=1 Tax=Trifolium pratense TaxID=57577 RepID=UPI001E6903F6|nr:putative disease resistance protein At3g14460 isoform X2 [Trifolium pratense]